MAGQTTQVLATIDYLLAGAGAPTRPRSSWPQIFVANMKEFDGMNKA